jgi:hypothetical protein
MTGTDAAGNVYICTGDTTHPRWEPYDGTGDPGDPGDPGPPTTASGTCTYTPALAKHIVVHASGVAVNTGLHYGGSVGLHEELHGLR